MGGGVFRDQVCRDGAGGGLAPSRWGVSPGLDRAFRLSWDEVLPPSGGGMLGLDVAEAFLGRGPQAASGGPVQAVPKSALDSSLPPPQFWHQRGLSLAPALASRWGQLGTREEPSPQ